MSRTNPTRRRQSYPQRQAAIENAAVELFAERGYAGTTLDEIAAAAGTTKPMIYRHFESKQALALALLAKHRDELAHAALAEYRADQPIDALIPTITDAWFAYVERHPSASKMLLRDAVGDPEIEAFQRQLRATQRAADMALIREHQGSTIPESLVEPLAEIVRSSLTALALWWFEHPEVPRAVPVEAIVRVTSGLLKPPAQHTPHYTTR